MRGMDMKQTMEQYTEVAGFCFEDEGQAAQAIKETEGIKYMKSKINMDNPDMVLEVYHRMIKEKLFETPVGFTFLKELQEYLVTIPFVRNEDVQLIPVLQQQQVVKDTASSKWEERRQQEKKAKEARKEKKEALEIRTKNIDFKKRFQRAFMINIALIVIVVAMFAISMTSNNVTILNYENSIINKYENWEQELDEREAELNQREAVLTQNDK